MMFRFLKNIHTYVIVACATVTFSVFAQSNYPASPEGLVMHSTDVPGEAFLQWQPVTRDIKGFIYPEGSVTYSVYTLNGYARTLVQSGLTETEFTFQAVPEGEQQFVECLVFAYYDGLESDGAITEMIPLGTPYLAINETFAETRQHYIWAVDASGYVDVTLSNENSCGIPSPDGADDGYLEIRGEYASGRGCLYSGLVTLENMEHPHFSIDVYNVAEADDNDSYLNLFGVTNGDESEKVLLQTVNIRDIAEPGEWGTCFFSLDSFGGETMQFVIEGVLSSYPVILLDNIRVNSILIDDLEAVSISAPEYVACGDEFEVEVTVRNAGLEEADYFGVEFYSDGHLVQTLEGKNLLPDSEMTFSIRRIMSSVAVEPVVFYAKVVYYFDENTDNNITEQVTIYPRPTEMPAPTDLWAQYVEPAVELKWNAPDLSGYHLLVTGYNVYRDNVRINDMPVPETSYFDYTIFGGFEYVYAVTALYEDGSESTASNIASVDLSRVDAIGVADAVVTIQGNMLVIKGLEGVHTVVASMTGEVVWSGILSGNEQIALPAGIYIVKAGNRVQKVII